MSAIASMYVSHVRVIAIVCIPQNIFLAESDMRIKSKEASLHQQLQINTCHLFPRGRHASHTHHAHPSVVREYQPHLKARSRTLSAVAAEIKTSNAAFIGLIE